ncbi:Olfactory receptor 7G3 [Sciurus carolinensis]|uniref:Olfactory receptor 7G3 n=1 Tax=Sciurus carolinensis TaxID=30640 RepID=A0AA41N9F5_SCICA|nr:Olfactory receptor 7G3 [Sciurus carolinensis]
MWSFVTSKVESPLESCLCALLVILSLPIRAVDALLSTLVVLQLSRTDLENPHCLCELAQMIKLTCSDTLVNDIVVHSPLHATWEIVLSLRSFSQKLELSAHF